MSRDRRRVEKPFGSVFRVDLAADLRYSIHAVSEIRVVFPERGGVVVSPERKAILGREYVTWTVASANPRVRRVKIEFASADARFFPHENSPTHRWAKNVEYPEGGPAPYPGHALLWGMAPAYADEEARRDTYEIYGLDANGDIVACAGPQIVVDRP